RALMGSNMQRQAVSCIKPDSPVVGTGVEAKAAYDSGQVVISETDGTVLSVTGEKIIISEAKGGKKKEYLLQKFIRSNTSTSINQHPIVSKGQIVKAGQPIADGAAIEK